MSVIKDDKYYETLDKRTREWKEWNARKKEEEKSINKEADNTKIGIKEPVLEDTKLTFYEEFEEKPIIEKEKIILPQTERKLHTTKHKFIPGDTVWVSDFSQIREKPGYFSIINKYKFNPKKGEVERLIVTDKNRYKLKGIAGSLYDEEDVCYTKEEAVVLCNIKNSK